MKYLKQVCTINNTKYTDDEMKEKFAPIIDYVNSLPPQTIISFGMVADKGWAYNLIVSAETTAYCKGIAAEIKQMCKNIYKSKVEVVFEAS